MTDIMAVMRVHVAIIYLLVLCCLPRSSVATSCVEFQDNRTVLTLTEEEEGNVVFTVADSCHFTLLNVEAEVLNDNRTVEVCVIIPDNTPCTVDPGCWCESDGERTRRYVISRRYGKRSEVLNIIGRDDRTVSVFHGVFTAYYVEGISLTINNITAPNITTVAVNDSVIISCAVTKDFPPLKASMFKDGVQLNVSHSVHPYGTSMQRAINSVNCHDSGNYTCQFSSTKNNSFVLNVTCVADTDQTGDLTGDQTGVLSPLVVVVFAVVLITSTIITVVVVILYRRLKKKYKEGCTNCRQAARTADVMSDIQINDLAEMLRQEGDNSDQIQNTYAAIVDEHQYTFTTDHSPEEPLVTTYSALTTYDNESHYLHLPPSSSGGTDCLQTSEKADYLHPVAHDLSSLTISKRPFSKNDNCQPDDYLHPVSAPLGVSSL